MTDTDMKIPVSKCPTCGHELNRASEPTGIRSPTPGDISVCGHCAEALIFDKDLKLSKIVKEFKVSMRPDSANQLALYQEAIRRLHEESESW